jgi:lipid II:glycine glycyltransferase (peptidoglycan interpeptide bridge formation enzyme)
VRCSASHSAVKTHTRTGELRVSISEELHDPEWDGFVFEHREPHHEQTSLWGGVRQKYGWHPVRLVMRQGDQIVAGAQILEHRIARVFKVGYLPRGPLLLDGADEALFVDALKRVARDRRLAYLAISLPYYSHSMARLFEQAGFMVRPDRLPPAVWVKATVVIDLRQEVDGILAGMSSTKRKQVRRSQRAGIDELLDALCHRRGVSRNIPEGDYPGLLWDAFSPGGHIKLLLAELDREVVSAVILFTLGQWVRAWRIGWSGKHEDHYPNVALYWESIRWAKTHGYRYFDVLGIDVEDARELLAGRDRSAPFKCSVTYSKVSLGGQILVLPGEYCYFPNSFLRAAFQTAGQSLLDSRSIRCLTRALHSSSIRVKTR